jgi:hypothetical protein
MCDTYVRLCVCHCALESKWGSQVHAKTLRYAQSLITDEVPGLAV